MTHRFLMPLLLLLALSALPGGAQTIYEYKQDDARILFFDKNLSRPAIQPPMMMLSNWADDGNGGAASIPQNMINIEMAPLNFFREKSNYKF